MRGLPPGGASGASWTEGCGGGHRAAGPASTAALVGTVPSAEHPEPGRACGSRGGIQENRPRVRCTTLPMYEGGPLLGRVSGLELGSPWPGDPQSRVPWQEAYFDELPKNAVAGGVTPGGRCRWLWRLCKGQDALSWAFPAPRTSGQLRILSVSFLLVCFEEWPRWVGCGPAGPMAGGITAGTPGRLPGTWRAFPGSPAAQLSSAPPGAGRPGAGAPPGCAAGAAGTAPPGPESRCRRPGHRLSPRLRLSV